MNRKKKLMRNILIITVFSVIVSASGSFYIDPMAAHLASERSFHYGPSDVVHVADFSGGKHFLGKYDRWISCNTIEKDKGPFWRFGSQVTGVEVDHNNPLTYTWNFMRSSPLSYTKVYGILHDQSIVKVEVHLMDGRSLTQHKFYEDMFLLHWDEPVEFDKIVAYDDMGTVIFEEERLR